ncbi:MAG: hypothetical protein CLLPBCKN_002569 [Chroococcidiopsis cubana SAG 39.79]|uniref:DUF4870 domain-containing protein n=1 Tax=Chroococcidiopsis cubana SAG 39.79 TaxID=388085 RepID=A0AB37UF69_9CYAN|nr:DUF4870 domain-containing protein [Chroococcidiopsis cubana]MDZ4873173.1 hypothetical protein [Chroococcidiopsis cubana SAG 39.79]RUT08672.1 hypothetical protein DSM107010_47430 [Chroococcidiopsis cubana SAG 39.79]
MYDPDKRKLLSAISHGAIFFSTTLVSVGIPIAILFVSDDPIVKENAKEAINFHLNVWFWALVIGVLVTISFGLLFPLAGLGFLIHWGLTILAIVKVLSHPDESFRYPFIVRLL